MTETIAVPVALLTELAKAASAAERSALASQVFDLLPKPKLRVFNIESVPFGTQRVVFEPKALEAWPDPMALIEHEVKEVFGPMYDLGDTARDVLLARIRTALEGATS